MKHQRIHSAVRYASRSTGVDFDKWITWGLIAGGIYVVYQVVTTIKATGEVLGNAGSAIGTGLYDFFHRDPLGESVYYTVTFPDGSRHSIPSRSVDNGGLFRNTGNGLNYLGDGATYRLVRKKDNGALYATPA